MMWNAGSWGWIWMTLMMALFWGGLVAIIVWAVRRPESTDAGAATGAGPGAAANAILEERLARGEISPAEFEERRRLLTGST